jgi:hypothetical protein
MLLANAAHEQDAEFSAGILPTRSHLDLLPAHGPVPAPEIQEKVNLTFPACKTRKTRRLDQDAQMTLHDSS